MIETSLLLLVVVPLAAAPLALLLGVTRDAIGWPIAAAVSVIQVGLAVALAVRTATDGRFSYYLGGFSPPFGIELVADGLSVTLLLLVAVVTLGTVAYARQTGPRTNEFYVEFLLLVGGLSGVCATGDVFNLYVFLEISGLAAYVLVASDGTGDSAVASLKYLILGTIGASLYLFGIGYLYVLTGTLNMADLAVRLAELGHGHTLAVVAFGLIVVGLAVKIALFPLHTWQPDAYAAAPDSVSAYIAALVSTVAAYALARIVFSVFTVEFFVVNPLARDALLAAAGVSIIAGAVLAVVQTDVKRLLAYSSVSQFGLVVAAFAIGTELAVLGGVVQLVGHALMKGGLFLAAGAIAVETGVRDLRQYAGIAEARPIEGGSLAVLAFGMVGVPPTVGFVGKWYVVLGALEAGAWPIAVVVLASTLLTLAYFTRLIERMYFGTAPGGSSSPVADGGQSVTTWMLAPLVVAAVLAVGLGLGVAAFQDLLLPTNEVLVTP